MESDQERHSVPTLGLTHTCAHIHSCVDLHVHAYYIQLTGIVCRSAGSINKVQGENRLPKIVPSIRCAPHTTHITGISTMWCLNETQFYNQEDVTEASDRWWGWGSYLAAALNKAGVRRLGWHSRAARGEKEPHTPHCRGCCWWSESTVHCSWQVFQLMLFWGAAGADGGTVRTNTFSHYLLL